MLLVLLGCGDLIPVIPTLTISGHLFKDCGGEPVTTGTLTIWNSFGKPIATAVPDASGFFNLEYRGAANHIGYDDNIGFSSDQIYGADPSGSITAGDLGDLYVNNKGSIRVTLKVLSPKTSSDTLLLRSIEGEVKIAGPFMDGTTHLFEDIHMQNQIFAPCLIADSDCENCIRGGIEWRLNNIEANSIELGLCGCGQVNEVEIVIE